MNTDSIKSAAKELKEKVKELDIGELKAKIKELDVKELAEKVKDIDVGDLKEKVKELDVKELEALKDAVLMEGEIKKEKLEADLRKVREDAELKAQVLREAAEQKKNQG